MMLVVNKRFKFSTADLYAVIVKSEIFNVTKIPFRFRPRDANYPRSSMDMQSLFVCANTATSVSPYSAQ